MKCSNCGNEVDPNSAYCPVCGTKVGAEAPQNPVEPAQEPVVGNGYVAPAQEPVVEQPVQPTYEQPVQPTYEQPVQQPVQEAAPVQQPVEPAQPVYQEPVQQQPVYQQPVQQAAQQPAQPAQPTYQASPEAKTAKNANGRHSIIPLVGIIAAVVVVGLVCLLAFGSKSPEKIYKTMLSEAINETVAGDAVTANSADVTASFTINTNIDGAKDVLDGIQANMNVQYDRAAQQAVVALDVTKGKDKYLNVRGMADLLNKVAAVEETNLFSKMISAEIPEEVYDELEEVLGEDYTFETDAAASRKAAKIINSTIESNIKDEWFSKEKVTTQENGKLTDNIFTIRETELEDLVLNVVKSLRVNNDFLGCYRDRDAILEILDQIEDQYDGMADEDVVYTIHYYTKAFNKFVGAAIVQKDEYWEEEEIVEIEKKSKNEYEIRIEENDSGDLEVLQTINVVANKLNKNDVDVEITMDIEDEGYIKIAATATAKYNKAIELLDTKNAVDYQDLTEDDMQEIMDNLEESPLYDLVEGYIGGATTTTTGSDRTTPSGITLLPGQSFVESYDDDVIVFNVPNSFEEDYGGTSYVRFSKEDKTKYTAYIDVDCEWDSLEDYREEIEDNLDYYTEDNGYSKVKLSDEETVTVGSNTFYKRTFTYTYGSYTAKRTYYYTKITDEYTYAIEIDDDDEIVTDSEIEKLLTIEVTLAK